MYHTRVSSWIVLIVSFLLFAGSCARSGNDKKDTDTQKRYQSPTAVFDAYREVREKQDWRKCFSLLTADAQKDAIFEQFFECAMANSDESRAILKKYVDSAAVNADYEKKYMEKHGIDIAKVSAGHENDPTFVPPPPDRDLNVDAVAAHVKDKAGFAEAVGNLFVTNPVSPIGDLENLTIDIDTATARAKITIVPTPGESPPKVDKIDKTFRFRKVNDGWLLDSL